MIIRKVNLVNDIMYKVQHLYVQTQKYAQYTHYIFHTFLGKKNTLNIPAETHLKLHQGVIVSVNGMRQCSNRLQSYSACTFASCLCELACMGWWNMIMHIHQSLDVDGWVFLFSVASYKDHFTNISFVFSQL